MPGYPSCWEAKRPRAAPPGWGGGEGKRVRAPCTHSPPITPSPDVRRRPSGVHAPAHICITVCRAGRGRPDFPGPPPTFPNLHTPSPPLPSRALPSPPPLRLCLRSGCWTRCRGRCARVATAARRTTPGRSSSCCCRCACRPRTAARWWTRSSRRVGGVAWPGLGRGSGGRALAVGVWVGGMRLWVAGRLAAHAGGPPQRGGGPGRQGGWVG